MHSIHVMLHRALMGGVVVAVLAAAVGLVQPWGLTAEAQHGGQHGAEQTSPEEHYAAIANYLELTDEQQEFLRSPMINMMQTIEELQQLHGVIAAELDDEQKAKLGNIVSGSIEAALGAAPDSHGHERH